MIRKPVRYEVWDLRKPHRCPFCHNTKSRDRFIAAGWGDVALILDAVNWTRRRVRIRTFYDRHLRTRVVQILTGVNG